MTKFGPHVAIVNPDDSKRFRLGRFITRQPVSGWKVYRSEDGKEILLVAIE